MLIDILLATYNGEKYIAQQIYSLLAQTHQDWNLYVADDGSTDNTIEIIKSIMSNDDRLNIIDFEKPVKSAAKNFWRLLPYSKAEYAIFCDQDDVWLDNKLELLLHKSKEWMNKGKPNLVFCDTYIYNQMQSKIISDTLYPYLYLSFEDFIFHNGGYQGCSTMFNKPMRDKLMGYTPDIYLHDEILALTAHTFGEVLFLEKSLMLYRVHDNNLIAETSSDNVYSRRLKQVFFRDNFVIYKPSYGSKVSFYNFFGNEMSDIKKNIFERYFGYCNSHFIRRLKISISSDISKPRMYIVYRTLTKKLFNI